MIKVIIIVIPSPLCPLHVRVNYSRRIIIPYTVEYTILRNVLFFFVLYSEDLPHVHASGVDKQLKA